MSNSITHSPVVLYHCAVARSVYNSPGVIDIAKSFLVGQHTNYFFFQVDQGYYCLIMCDDVTSVSVNGTAASFACDTATVYDIYIEEDTDSRSIDFSGRASGSFAGVSPFPSAGDWSGSVSGSSTYDTISYEYFFTQRIVPNVSIYNPDYRLCYSSIDGYPKLIEGVEYYAFAAFALCFGIIGFKLLDRIFRRIY